MCRRVASCCLLALLATLPVSGRQSRTGWFDLPVQGGAATLESFGIPAEERALTLSLLARALLDRETRFSKSPHLITDIVNATTTPAVGADTGRDSIEIPAPLDADTWRQLLDLSGDADLFARLLTDRQALLLASALTVTDDSIRRHLAGDRDLLRFLYREGAAAFHLAARSLAVADGRVVAPGGDDAPAIWESLAGVSTSRVSPFIRALASRDQGRLAWYFDAIAQMDERRLAAAWPRGSAGRAASARAFYDVFRESDPPWRPSEQPFRRSIGDAWSVAMLADVADGQPIGPTAAAFWRLAFESDNVDVKDAERQLSRETATLSLPAITREIVMQPPRDRRQRFEMFRLAQRVFPSHAGDAMPAVAVAVNGYKRFPSLLLALERMAITAPGTWAALVAAARHVTDDAEAAEASLASFQGTIAILERLAHTRALDAPAAERLLLDLAAAVRADRKVSASLARWITATLVPALPPLDRPDALSGRTAYESRVLQALAGPRADGHVRSLDWEGLRYSVDLTAAEHMRVQAVRRLLPSPGLDAALTSKNPRDLAAALTAVVYAVALGRPDGAALLSRDVATRHDFGFNATALLQRIMPWAPPEERQGDGPWHVVGALIGLDLGLSRLALRRVADEQMPQAPVLTLNDFATLARTIVALVPTTLHDADRDALTAAMARGRQRVLDARQQPDALLALARQVRMSAATQQALPWMVSHQPQAIAGAFSLRDLLWLGEPALTRAVLDRWGVAGQAFDGRQVTLMPAPAPWEDFAGRPDAGQMTTQLPDLTLRLAEETARLRLPASLIPALLAYAVEDFWHDAQARFADDWPRMTRQAAAMNGTRVEDYVAALVGDGVLRP